MKLRALDESDVASLLRILRAPEVAKWWPEWTEEEVRSDLVGKDNVFGIDIGVLAGAIQFYENPDDEYRYAGIDLFIAPEHHRKGIGTAAIRAVIDLLWARGHHRIVIDPALENTVARRAYEKLGFRVVGPMEKYERGHDGVLMELVRHDFTPAPPKDVRARDATEADVPKLLEWMARFNAFEHIDFDPKKAEPLVRHLLRTPELGKLVVFEPPGYAMISYGFDIEYGGRDAFLTELWLEPESRGGGKSALDRVLAIAKANGVRSLHLQVRHDNPRAVALYRGAGFETSLRALMSKKLA